MVPAAAFGRPAFAKPQLWPHRRAAGSPVSRQLSDLPIVVRRHRGRVDGYTRSARKPAGAGLLGGILDGIANDSGIWVQSVGLDIALAMVWPAAILLLGFSAFTLADPAPDDPARLAKVIATYSLLTFAGMALVGPRRWLRQVEFLSVLMAQFGRLGLLARRGRRARAGWPGWQLASGGSAVPGIPVFILVLLGTGSFDGFNETFVWLDLIGVNPLAFPGRSAVIGQVITGLVVANLLLIGLFLTMIRIGDGLVSGNRTPAQLLALFAPTILPIALAYHTAHYLPSLLVDGQYVMIALNDPFGTGADILRLADYYITTGFFNHRETMRVIWLTQAAVIVLGHVIAVILAHAAAVQAYGDVARAFRAGLPLALFMVLYTWLGLWLLAAPKGG